MEDAKGVPEGNINAYIRYFINFITSYTYCVLSTTGRSISSTLITCSLPTGHTNCTPGYSSAAPYSHIGDTG